jgi:hypothetical protein
VLLPAPRASTIHDEDSRTSDLDRCADEKLYSRWRVQNWRCRRHIRERSEFYPDSANELVQKTNLLSKDKVRRNRKKKQVNCSIGKA